VERAARARDGRALSDLVGASRLEIEFLAADAPGRRNKELRLLRRSLLGIAPSAPGGSPARERWADGAIRRMTAATLAGSVHGILQIAPFAAQAHRFRGMPVRNNGSATARARDPSPAPSPGMGR